jgi:DNA-binding XRE family transcriptional regulator
MTHLLTNLRQLRTNHLKITQSELAQRLGISVRTVAR